MKHKFYIILLSFIISSCSFLHSSVPYSSLKQCNSFVIYKISSKMYNHRLVIKSFDYWNKILQKEFFIFGGIIDDEEYTKNIINHQDNNYIFVYMDYIKDSKLEYCGKTFYTEYNFSSCINEISIVLKSQCFVERSLSFESVMRHEIGHTLGFKNSFDDSNDIMYYTVDRMWWQLPKEISEKEKIVLKEKYP